MAKVAASILSVASILNSTVPLFTIVIAPLFLPDRV